MKRVFCLTSFILIFTTIFSQEKPDALKMYRQGNYKRAIEICKQEISEKPNNLDSYVVLTWALVADKQYQETVKWCEEGRKIARFDPRILETQAEAYFYLGNNELSLRLFQDYITYAPNGVKLPIVYYFMGEIYLRMAMYRHADISFSVAVTLNARNAEWWARLGYVREQAKEYFHSLEAYNQALFLNKNLTDAQKGKERVLRYF